MARIFNTPADLLQAAGTDLGRSDWLLIDQARINAFAEVTGDDQWIHVEPELARNGPFGTTIAHGYLTLSLVNMFLPRILLIKQFSSVVNVGADRLRFVAPVPVNSRVRGHGEIISAEEVKGGAIQAVIRITIEIEGAEKPALVIDKIARYFP